ncbi:phosphoribosyl-dephospho-CoA transferase MdcG domain-containing protein, partial [Shigella flexneri]|uniref:phosphoribosyl-dephospho-CoA transferase MdcG domain-containing protein n=1 Tax=Shigella flexneri TaxID=623 RepID=UPI003FA6840F
MRWLGQRLRLAVNVPVRAIVRYSTPEQTARLPLSNRTTATRAFNRLRESGCWQELRMGVWGSVALEMVTPWQWTDNHSDLDIQIMPESLSSIAQCLETLRNIEHHYQLRIDGEILLSNGYAINIKEWFSGSLTLLAKGENDVQLITRQDV